ncbi:hypothetical protein BDR07DRAFT_1381731 [Suillus spraguei]|nr:hypothetical protein BDR07DRAFT_1381731 [Suillus spraguei]
MTMEEQELAMDDLMLKISEQCEVKDLTVHNVPLHNSRKTLESMDRELEALYTCMGMEIILFIVHSDVDHFNQPHIFQTDHAASFFNACFGSSINQVVLCLEGYSVAGVQGMAKTHIQEVLEWKKKTSELILTKILLCHLQELPLSKFCYPGDISSLNELHVLFHAFMMNATKFQRLSDMEQHFQNSSDTSGDNTNSIDTNSNDAKSNGMNSNGANSNDANFNEEGVGSEEGNTSVSQEASYNQEGQRHPLRPKEDKNSCGEHCQWQPPDNFPAATGNPVPTPTTS